MSWPRWDVVPSPRPPKASARHRNDDLEESDEASGSNQEGKADARGRGGASGFGGLRRRLSNCGLGRRGNGHSSRGGDAGAGSDGAVVGTRPLALAGARAGGDGSASGRRSGGGGGRRGGGRGRGGGGGGGGGRRDRRGAGRGGGGLRGLESTGDAVGGGALGEVHGVGAAPGLELVVVGAVEARLARVCRSVLASHVAWWARHSDVARTASAVAAAGLVGLGVVAVDGGIVGSALGEAGTTSLSAGVAVTTDGLLGLVSEGVAAREAQARDGHDGELVGLGLRGRAGGAGQDGDRGSRTEEHFDG